MKSGGVDDEKEPERKPSVKRVSFGVNDFLQVMERRRFHSDSAILEGSTTKFDEPPRFDEIDGRRLSDNVFVDENCQQSQSSEVQISRGFESHPDTNSFVGRRRTASGINY